jgi:putative glycosyltransferase
LIDSDLEEKPEWLGPVLSLKQMTKDNADTVYGIQEHRKGGILLKKITGAVFYKVFRLLTGVAQPK